MRNSILSAALIASAVLGGVVGGGIQANRDVTASESSWDGVFVVSKAGTLVANPSALTPRELASYKIIDPMDHLTICTDRKGETFINPKDDECRDFKSIRHL